MRPSQGASLKASGRLSKRLSMSSLALFRAKKTSTGPTGLGSHSMKAQGPPEGPRSGGEGEGKKERDGNESEGHESLIQSQQSMRDIADMKEFSEQLLGTPDDSQRAKETEELNAEERQDIERLLELCGGPGAPLDASTIRSNVDGRMQALEEENIRSVVESRAAVDDLVARMDSMLEQLDDVDTWLGHYNSQLKSMQKHVEQIKAENATLERVTKNKHRLADTLQEIVGVLTITAEMEQTAKARVQELNEPEGMQRALRTAAALKRGLGHQFCEDIAGMRAVKEQREKMERLQECFAKTLHLFFKQQFGLRLRKGEIIGPGGEIAPVEQAYLVRERLFHRLGIVAPLLQWLQDTGGEESRARLLDLYASASRDSYKRELGLFHQHLRFFLLFEEKDVHFLALRRIKVKKQKLDKKGCPSVPRVFKKKASLEKLVNFAIRAVVLAIEQEHRFCSRLFNLSSREAGALVGRVFDGQFAEFEELISLCDSTDYFYLISVLSTSNYYIEKHCETDLAVIVAFMTKLQTSAKQKFNKHIDAAMTCIKDVQQKAGILPYMEKLPLFLDRMEAYVTESSRGAIQPSYHKLVSSIFSKLNQTKATEGDSHRAAVLKLENYHFFLRALERKKLNALSAYEAQARKSYEENLEAYLSYLLKKSFSSLLEFFGQVDEMLHSIPAEEIQFRNTHSQNAFLKVSSKNTMAQVERKAAKLKKKVSLLRCSSKVSAAITRALHEQLLTRWRHWEELAKACYDKALPVSSKDLQALLDA